MTHGTFQPVGFRTQEAEIKVKRRVHKTGRKGFFQFFDRLGLVVFRLGVNPLTNMKHDFSTLVLF
jgi:hypothetical protein